jgi:hypothetical protein
MTAMIRRLALRIADAEDYDTARQIAVVVVTAALSMIVLAAGLGLCVRVFLWAS